MRDWTKAMAALFAAISSVGLVQAISAQEAGKATTVPAVRAEDADPFAQAPTVAAPKAPPGTELSKDQVNVTDLGTVEIHVKDQNLLDVLRMLSLQTKKNIVPTKGVGGVVTADLYNVTVREALDAILAANGFAYRERGNFIFVYTVAEMNALMKAERHMRTEIVHLNYIPGPTAVDMIRPAMSSDAVQPAVYKDKELTFSSSAKDIEFGTVSGQDTIVITDWPENVTEAMRILKELDTRPKQILVEATILQVRLTDNNSLGVDFSILGGVDFSTAGTTNTGVLATNTPGTPGSPSSNAGLSSPGYNAIGTNVKGLNTTGLNIGVAYNNVAVFVNALEAVQDTVVLANPKVLTLNRQPGVVIVGKKDGYYTTTVTQTSTVQTVEYLETGTRLIFQPFISDDGYIRMKIHPEDSTGGVNNQNLPQKQTAEVTTNVMVKDGHTIVIGGLFRENNQVTKSQVPFLGDIPLAGALFRSQSDSTDRQEVVILITPHIINDTQYSEVSEEMMKHADLMRVGIRKGMMPWSRDRLADMAYEKAKKEMSEKYYDRAKVLWYLDCATNLRPNFTEALVLKERVTGEQISCSDDSAMRHFLTEMIREDRTKTIDPALGTVPAFEPSPVTKPEEMPEMPTTAPAMP